MKIFIHALTVITAMSLTVSAAAQNEDKEMDKFITKLMKGMSLEEKLGQLNLGAAGDPYVLTSNYGLEDAARHGLVGAVPGCDPALQKVAVEESPSGIPVLFGLDVIHGYNTTFPIPLAQACSWNIDMVRRGAQIAAKEATANGICWTWSPMVDIARDPRWGRVAEGAGEDPYLGSRIAQAMVQGYQGTDMAADTTLL
ncbi:MAG: beta-glucosidase, partial [Bacteroidales bacterium]|nr:beta-glucosidase [Bacteroidales bacterium]